MNRISIAVVLLACAGCKNAPVVSKADLAPVAQSMMVELKTELPLAKLDRSPKPPQKSSQAFLVPEGTRLLSRGVKVKSSDGDPIIGKLEMITDGNKEAHDEFTYTVDLMPGLQWVQLDLGKSYALYAILVWHHYWHYEGYDYLEAGEQGYLARVYQDVVIQISNDQSFSNAVTTVYNNDHDNSSGLGKGSDVLYVENSDGRWINAKGIEGRYVRLYSRGHKRLWAGKDLIPIKKYADYLDSNNYIEVEVYGK